MSPVPTSYATSLLSLVPCPSQVATQSVDAPASRREEAHSLALPGAPSTVNGKKRLCNLKNGDDQCPKRIRSRDAQAEICTSSGRQSITTVTDASVVPSSQKDTVAEEINSSCAPASASADLLQGAQRHEPCFIAPQGSMMIVNQSSSPKMDMRPSQFIKMETHLSYQSKPFVQG